MAFTSNDVDRLTGAIVRGTDDDKIGSIGQVYVDQDGTPVWATVKTGFFGTSESFIPLDSASLGAANGVVVVPFDKDVVKNAPRIESDAELNPSETDDLYDYYEGHSIGGTSTPIFDQDDMPSTATTGTGSALQDADVETSGTDARSETDKEHVGHDTSGPSTDDAMTRSEERLNVSTEKVESGRARLRKHIVTEQQTVTVPVTHEEATLVREPITDANIGEATAGAELSEEEHEVVLHGEEVVTSKDTVPVERVRLGTEQVTEQQQVTQDVSKEQIDYVDTDGTITK